MLYNFDEINDRRNTGSLKWDVTNQELPMWVADMDFKTAPCVIHALERKVKEGIFGYQIVPDEWYEAFQSWWERRHDFKISKEWMTFCTGVVPAITSAIKRITNIGDNVVVQTPVYDIFFHSIENTGRHVFENKLQYDGTSYQIDYNDLEQKLANPQTTMMILCNPHNPVGKIWSKEELQRIGALCHKYHVIVLSDEIHCDLIDPGCHYTPFASVSELCRNISMTCISATKAFNIAGLQTAAVVIANESLNDKVIRGLNSDEVAEPNAFATTAAIAALNEGEEWLNQLNSYLYENKQYVRQYIKENIPQIKVVSSQATYLLWLDCGELGIDGEQFGKYLKKEHGLYLSTGIHYRGNSESFLRMNTACPRTQLKEGLRRLEQGVKQYIY